MTKLRMRDRTERFLSELESRATLVMGIINVTPDSFSDGGSFSLVDAAIQRGRQLGTEGASIIDIGGESTRPGAARVESLRQIERVLPVIEGLVRFGGGDCLLSVDTTRSDVAEAALTAGADIVNDISAGTDDSAMFSVAKRFRAPIVLMHMQGSPSTMQIAPAYSNVVGEVLEYLMARSALAISAGLSRDQIVLDPGIGFGKNREHNLSLLAHLDCFVATGFPVLLGASRKRFMGAICREDEPRELLGATLATTALAIQQGVRIVRVHDVKANRQMIDVLGAIGSIARNPVTMQ